MRSATLLLVAALVLVPATALAIDQTKSYKGFFPVTPGTGSGSNKAQMPCDDPARFATWELGGACFHVLSSLNVMDVTIINDHGASGTPSPTKVGGWYWFRAPDSPGPVGFCEKALNVPVPFPIPSRVEVYVAPPGTQGVPCANVPTQGRIVVDFN